MEKNKTTIFVILACILLIGITVSFAYYLASIQGEGKSITLKSKNLKITFTESNNLSGENISPGWSKTSTFTVKNEGSNSYTYNIVIKDLVNTFVTTGNLQYKITSTDGGYNMTDFKDIPKSSVATNKNIATNITIAGNGTHTYTILFTYKNSEDNQAEDMGKTLSGQIIMDEYVLTLADKILEDNPTVSTRTEFSTPFTTNTANTIYKSTENGIDVYYFAGQDTASTPVNNWVKFGKEKVTSCTYNGEEVYYPMYYTTFTDEDGTEYKDMLSIRKIRDASECTSLCIINGKYSGNPKFTGLTETQCNDLDSENTYLENGATVGQTEEKDIYWRIIRTNENGGLKLLYFGNNPNSISQFIGYSAFGYDDRDIGVFSAGYMTGNYNDDYTNELSNIANTRKNEENNIIKTFLDDWYRNNIYQNYDKYTDKDVIYCNDRSYENGEENYFGAQIRLETNKTPTYQCGGNGKGGLFENSQSIADKFNVSGQNGGNGKLTYPIALISVDEIAYAGGVYNKRSPMWYSTNSSNESSTSSFDWWTMTPYSYDVDAGTAIIAVDSSGITKYSAYDLTVVKPVTSLNSCVQWKSGDGSAESPYEVNGGC